MGFIELGDCKLNINSEKIEAAFSETSFLSQIGKDRILKEMITDVDQVGDDLSFKIKFGYPIKSKEQNIREKVVSHLRHLFKLKNVKVVMETDIVAHAIEKGTQLIPGVKNIIAIASGKGGVGKSTTTVNLALSLHAEGAKVGILDGDIYGPSIPALLGVSGKPESPDGKTILPMMGHGVQTNSIGFLIPKDEAMVWRGPMVTQALEQLLRQTVWDKLDYLLIDLPPGTGDIHLTLAQKVPLTGAVIVTTPQEIALLDARKGIKMFEKVSVPILGIIENMATYACPGCGNVEEIFGSGGGLKTAEKYNTNFLGSLPLITCIREDSDNGIPSVASERNPAVVKIYKEVSSELARNIAMLKKDSSAKFPKIVVKNH